MLMAKALKNRSIALLWSGQALSAIGDEIYRVALIWLAVGLVGADTGYLAAGQCVALLTLSLVGGKWADHWDHFRTMIWVDGLRTLIVILPVIAVHFVPISMPLLWAVALSVSALSALFDPALQALLPRFAPDTETLQAATGLMSTTQRLARVAGPGIIGVLTPFMPPIQLFSIEGLSFAISALSIHSLSSAPAAKSRPKRRPARLGFRESVLAGFRAARRTEHMSFIVWAKGFSGGAWNLAYSLGLALLARKIAPHDVRAFGMVVGAYGIGNLSAALWLANRPRKRSTLIMFTGYAWMGMGFVLIALSPTLRMMMISAVIAAIGGPMNDLPFVDMVQERFPIEEIPMIFRLRMALETAATLICMVISPFLFRVLHVRAVIGICGIALTLIGVAGLVRCEENPIGDLLSRILPRFRLMG